jgi:hypothetical protein
MPTARELLEQADALMRRNRARADVAGEPAVVVEIPELTEVATPEPVGDEALQREALATQRPLPVTATQPGEHESRPASAERLDDIPELTEAVEEIDAPSIVGEDGAFDLGEPSVFMGPGHGEVRLAGPWPAPAMAQPPDAASSAVAGVLSLAPEWLDEDLIDSLPADALALAGGAVAAADGVAVEAYAPSTIAAEGGAAGAGAAAAAPPAPGSVADDAARWTKLAEEIRMQVLQRIDIFTDTGLQEQLALRLRPIVDRASADLLAGLNQHVGQLLRAYVAEAIEHEIEKWRAGDR